MTLRKTKIKAPICKLRIVFFARAQGATIYDLLHLHQMQEL